MRVLILGGYGLIGADIARALLSEGFDVVALGRDAEFGRRILPEADWIGADIAKLTSPEDWKAPLDRVGAVVNASGALQDGARDRLAAVQDKAIRALIAAAESSAKIFVQISAPGATPDASTAFLRTKAAADDALRNSALDWVIFKPGLVVGRNAAGGTALLRTLAGFPLAAPLVLGDARLQTVAMSDVARAVVMALKGAAPLRADYDLGENESRTLRETVLLFRRWLGFRGARAIALPRWVGGAVAALADLAGLLGWRSPLRSTSLKVLSGNVVCDGAPWTTATGMTFKTLDDTLAQSPATAQDRLFARAQIVLPMLIVVLAAYWIVSGAVGFVALDTAAAHLVGAVDARAARALVGAASAVDIVIGAGLLVRATTRGFAVVSIAVAAFYLAAGTIIAPELWLDPLGVLVKVVPAIALAAAVALLMTER